ncbi:MAG: TonB-dependent siderophore receptor [Methyloglobulus sp.]|nr:TonB-dependent siderophore receptor [Methyloglobulus sp.]
MKTVQYYVNHPYFYRRRQIILLVVAVLLWALFKNSVRAEERTYNSAEAPQTLDDGKIIQVAANAKTNKASKQGINSRTNSDASETRQLSDSDNVTLEKITVEADADNPYDDPTWQTDPYNTDYVLPKATAGTKTNTPVMETPLNVQSISKQVLKDQQVIRLDQALKNVSGVTTRKDNFAKETLFLRGFGAETLFRNGFRMDIDTFANGQQFANVESVEVLKGPASILYGRVEPGGMINMVTKQPRATPYYSFNQQFGSYDLYRTSIDATGPLTKDDTLLYRVNASFQSNNSFRDLVSGEDVFFAPILKWNISPRTQATLEMEYNRALSSLDNQVLPLTNGQLSDLPHSRNLGERNPLESENIFVGFNWSHQFSDDWSLKHQVAFKRAENKSGAIAIPQQIDLNVDRNVGRFLTQISNQVDTVATNLDLTGHFKTWGLEHTLLLGGDFYQFDKYFAQAFGGDFSNINIDNPIHPGTPSAIGPNPIELVTGTNNYGLYLQDQIKLPYNLHVTGGFRYQYVHSATKFNDGSGVLKPSGDPLTDDAVTPRVGLLWRAKNWLSLYSNYTENFGANAGAFGFGGKDASGKNLAPKPLPPQSAQQWEVGVKTEFFDGRLRATLAYYDLTKQNVATVDRAHPIQCAGPCFISTGEVNSHGPELDIQGEILPGWNVIATYTNQDVRVSKSNDTTGTAQEGFRLQFTPRNIGSAWTSYEVQNGDLKGFKIGGGVNFQDSVVSYDNSDANTLFKSTGYALVNLMAGYGFEVGKSKVNLQLNIDNLLDKSYFTNIEPQSPSGFGFVNFSTPRTFMGSINVEY